MPSNSLSTSVSFIESGSPRNRALVLIHGSPGSGMDWSEVLNDVDLQKDFHIIAVDRPGYGRTQKGSAQPSLKMQAEQILSVLKINQSGLKPLLAGYSYGGAVAAQMLAGHPGHIAGVIFIAPSIDPAHELCPWYQKLACMKPISFFVPENLRVSSVETVCLNEELKNLEKEVQSNHVPVSLLQGQKDRTVSRFNELYLKKNYRLVHSEMARGLGHLLLAKRSDLILNHIKFMSTLI